MPFKGDFMVGTEQFEKGERTWGTVIIFLVFVPNLVFMAWIAHANRKRFGEKGTWAKIIIAGNVQLITVVRYKYKLNYYLQYFKANYGLTNL